MFFSRVIKLLDYNVEGLLNSSQVVLKLETSGARAFHVEFVFKSTTQTFICNQSALKCHTSCSPLLKCINSNISGQYNPAILYFALSISLVNAGYNQNISPAHHWVMYDSGGYRFCRNDLLTTSRKEICHFILNTQKQVHATWVIWYFSGWNFTPSASTLSSGFSSSCVWISSVRMDSCTQLTAFQ